MNSDERAALAQDIGLWMLSNTKHMIEAMPCECEDYDLMPGEIKAECNRCLKLKELK